ncbi:hypothetical protein Tco_0809176 [Tanacetum coccineum]
MVVEGEVLNDLPRFISILVAEFAAGGMDIVAEFYGPSWRKELSKEMSSKILPCGDGSCWEDIQANCWLDHEGKIEINTGPFFPYLHYQGHWDHPYYGKVSMKTITDGILSTHSRFPTRLCQFNILCIGIKRLLDYLRVTAAKSKVSVFTTDNKKGHHFAKGVYGLHVGTKKKQDRDNTRRVVPRVETTTSNALMSCDGVMVMDWRIKQKKGLGYNAVPPPYIGNFMPLKPDLSFSGLEEFMNEPIVSEPTVKKPVVETSEAKTSADKPKAVRKNNGALILRT